MVYDRFCIKVCTHVVFCMSIVQRSASEWILKCENYANQILKQTHFDADEQTQITKSATYCLIETNRNCE